MPRKKRAKSITDIYTNRLDKLPKGRKKSLFKLPKKSKSSTSKRKKSVSKRSKTKDVIIDAIFTGIANWLSKGKNELLQQERKRLLLSQTELQALSPSDFEEYVEFVFQEMGYKTEAQGNVNKTDKGIDIKAWKDNECVIIQCKRFTGANKVGIRDVRDLQGVVSKEKAAKGYLVTSSDFSKDARAWVIGTDVVLITPKEIDEWKKQYSIAH